jgi:hypothetical protein
MQAFQNVHLYALMAHLLEVEPAQTDGNLNTVSVMLKQ